MDALGQHILVEFMGCDPDVLNDVAVIEQGMLDAAMEANATIINSTFHYFSPYGVSGVVVIQESHLAVHTWPEYQYAAVDLFTCGDDVYPWKAFDYLKKIFQAENYSALEARRGSLNLLKRIEFNVDEMREEIRETVIPEKFKRNVWLTDRDENIALSLRYKGEILYNEKSDFQHVKVVDTYSFGKTLLLDNMVMCTEKDEFQYHEMMTHPVLLAHGDIRRVLVIGGGDGGVVREVLRHPQVEHVTMVEIDEKVVEAARLHLPQIAAQFDHPKLNLIIGDGIAYVNEQPDAAYDLIIVDSTDPVGPAEGLFSVDFYAHCHRILSENGVLVVQSEAPRFHEKTFAEINRTFKNIFGEEQVQTMLFHVPTYPTGLWSAQISARSNFDARKVDAQKVAAFVKEQGLKYYNYEIHQASFALPNYVKEMLATA